MRQLRGPALPHNSTWAGSGNPTFGQWHADSPMDRVNAPLPPPALPASVAGQSLPDIVFAARSDAGGVTAKAASSRRFPRCFVRSWLSRFLQIHRNPGRLGQRSTPCSAHVLLMNRNNGARRGSIAGGGFKNGARCRRTRSGDDDARQPLKAIAPWCPQLAASCA